MLVAKLGHGTTNVPYPIAPGLTEGPYVDLERFPQAIDEVPELRDWAELRSLIQVLNQPGSGARTIGSAKLLNIGTRYISYVQWVFQNKRKRKAPRYAYELFHAWAENVEYSQLHTGVIGTFEITLVASPHAALEGWSTVYNLISLDNSDATLALQSRIWSEFQTFIARRLPL